MDIGEEDAKVLEQFHPSAPKQKMTLADIIMEKINEKNAAEARGDDDGERYSKIMYSTVCSFELNNSFVIIDDRSLPHMNPKVVEVYTKYVWYLA